MSRTCQAEEGCTKTKLVGQGLCDCHYRMKRIYGRTTRIRRPNGMGSVRNDGYVQVCVDGKIVMEHILVMEKLLGKPIPAGAIVHHIDENRANNVPSNFVLCPDQAYHMLIHKLMYDKNISFSGRPPTPLGRCKRPPGPLPELFKREEALKRDD